MHVLENDIIGCTRALVTACRNGDQRRSDFTCIIEEGNKKGGWGEPPVLLRAIQLLRDVVTRWSATFLMVDRVLELIL
ncbi:hypothetical protein MPER_14604, partial [Moniliophthora perniciosa FA553]